LEKEAGVVPHIEKPIVYQARHFHTMGSCEGKLTLTALRIEFTSDEHTFGYDSKEISILKDGIKAGANNWHLKIAGVNIEQLLGKWKRGELFPPAAHEAGTAAPQQAQTQSGRGVARPYAARHKHGLSGCSGELILTPETIEFLSSSSPEHKFKYQINEVQIDQDGILDPKGKSWHFEIPGMDVGAMLRSWKAGKMY
jgi:hypothetical protein